MPLKLGYCEKTGTIARIKKNDPSLQPHKHSCAAGTTANYCTNNRMSSGCPESGPWCYTTDPAKRMDLCDIPLCADLETTSTTATPTTTASEITTERNV
ncbi:hypothetical protein NP493_26g07028 [Ridgeia piscesae]|uniref:Kringle domain-containing protein n=1 Tax=Ridgeia piscesae TaxID=27915 RepID=A0AAD9UKH9_RIDPI|nr:hypothetical protein NP493_26g07028 [Ridgeia piscesae]